jgi:hypothetical protein
VNRRILVFGDSHVHAIKEALELRGPGGTAIPIEVRRLLKSKATPSHRRGGGSLVARLRRAVGGLSPGGRGRSSEDWIGDTLLEHFLPIARRLSADDVLVSVIGGNQYAVFGTIQHPQPFDFFLPGSDPGEADPGVDLIPFRPLYQYFSESLRLGDGQTIAALRNSTKAQIVHLLAPPPKGENEYIEKHHDTLFAAAGISSLGVSPPALRMKFWELQNRAIEEICKELGVQTLAPPADAADPDGFLRRAFYAGDATHANGRYGELVLQQLERRFGPQQPADEQPAFAQAGA